MIQYSTVAHPVAGLQLSTFKPFAAAGLHQSGGSRLKMFVPPDEYFCAWANVRKSLRDGGLLGDLVLIATPNEVKVFGRTNSLRPTSKLFWSCPLESMVVDPHGFSSIKISSAGQDEQVFFVKQGTTSVELVNVLEAAREASKHPETHMFVDAFGVARRKIQEVEVGTEGTYDLTTHGKAVCELGLLNNFIRIFEHGYVQLNHAGIYKLIGISSSTNVSRKTGIGRAIGAVPTMGFNMALSSKNRGEAILSIVHEGDSVTLLVDNPMPAQLMIIEEIVAVGTAVLDSSSSSSSSSKPEVPQATSMADELTKLKALHTAGVLSDEEFEAAKSKLLS